MDISPMLFYMKVMWGKVWTNVLRIIKKIQQYADADFSSKNFLNFVKRILMYMDVAVVMCVLGNVHVKTVKKK